MILFCNEVYAIDFWLTIAAPFTSMLLINLLSSIDWFFFSTSQSVMFPCELRYKMKNHHSIFFVESCLVCACLSLKKNKCLLTNVWQPSQFDSLLSLKCLKWHEINQSLKHLKSNQNEITRLFTFALIVCAGILSRRQPKNKSAFAGPFSFVGYHGSIFLLFFLQWKTVNLTFKNKYMSIYGVFRHRLIM